MSIDFFAFNSYSFLSLNNAIELILCQGDFRKYNLLALLLLEAFLFRSSDSLSHGYCTGKNKNGANTSQALLHDTSIETLFLFECPYFTMTRLLSKSFI